MSSLLLRTLLTVLFVVWADVLFYGPTPGCSVSLFAIPLGIAAAVGFRNRLGRSKALVALWLLLAIGAALDASLIGRWLLIVLVWTILARCRRQTSTSLLDGVIRGIAGGLRSLSAGPADARRYALLVAGRAGVGVPPFWVVGLPILLVAVFAALIIPANVVLAQWTVDGFDRVADVLTHVSFGRVLFWSITALAVYGLFRFRLGRRFSRERPASPIFPTADDERSRNALKACLLTFGGLNALYLAANIVDAFFPWFGFELPAGTTYADFAHQGAYRLMIAAVLSAVTVTVFLPSGSPALAHRTARCLALLFVIQNLLILAAATRRLELYMEIYGLTRLRLAAVLWMLLVGIGFVLILIRIRGSKPVEFLFRTNAVSTLVLLSAVALWNVDGFIADWNVARYESGKQQVVDVSYLGNLDAGALPSLAHLARLAEERDDSQTAQIATETLRLRLHHLEEVLREWQSWTWRRSQATAMGREFLTSAEGE